MHLSNESSFSGTRSFHKRRFLDDLYSSLLFFALFTNTLTIDIDKTISETLETNTPWYHECTNECFNIIIN